MATSIFWVLGWGIIYLWTAAFRGTLWSYFFFLEVGTYYASGTDFGVETRGASGYGLLEGREISR